MEVGYLGHPGASTINCQFLDVDHSCDLPKEGETGTCHRDLTEERGREGRGNA